jgi:hypothetical protein
LNARDNVTVDKRLRWFDEGAPKLRQVLGELGLNDLIPIDGEFYACPCCLTVYSREAVSDGVLTIEDVPPKSVGGRPLLLTCKKCNNTAGADFDSQAAARAKVSDFFSGRMTGRPLPMTSYVDGIPLRGIAQRTSDGFQLFGVRKQNHPDVHAAYFAALDAYVESGNPPRDHSFTIQTPFDERRARISWIRAAYLAAFAALGYRYILRDVMKPYRQQLEEPDAELVPTYTLREHYASPETRRMLLVEAPDELRCVAVLMGNHTVFLPSISQPVTCHELAQVFSGLRTEGDRPTITLSGQAVPWPTQATYRLDEAR